MDELTKPGPTAAALTVEQVTLDQWLGLRDQVVGQVRRLVYLWFANGLGSQRELARQLNVSPGTISGHVKSLRAADELTEEMCPTHPEQRRVRTDSVRPVENPHPTPSTSAPQQPAPITHRSEPIEIGQVMGGVRELGPDEYTHQDYNTIIQLFEQIDNLTHENEFTDNFSKEEWFSLLGAWQSVGNCIRAKCDHIQRSESDRAASITVDSTQI